MDSLYYKKRIMKKRHDLHSMCAGIVFFCILYVYNKFCSFSLCPIKNIFGFSCFGCGLTRGFVAILKLDFKSAVRYNILSIPLFIGILLYCCFLVIDFVYKKEYIEKIERFLTRKYMYIFYLIIIVVVGILNNT